MKTTVWFAGRLLVVDVKEAKNYKVATFNALQAGVGKVVKTGRFCSVSFVKGW